MRFMQIESVLQTINRSEPAKNRFSVALVDISRLSRTIQTICRHQQIVKDNPNYMLALKDCQEPSKTYVGINRLSRTIQTICRL